MTLALNRHSAPVAAWIDAPPFPGAWVELAGEDFNALVTRIASLNEAGRHVARGAFTAPERVRILPTPFYPGIVMVDIQLRNRREALPESRCIYTTVYGQQGLVALNGQALPIHERNWQQIALSDDNVADYLRFFCMFVHGEEGPFLIRDTAEGVGLAGRRTKPVTQALAAIRPPRVLETPATSPQSVWRLAADVLYGGARSNC